MRQRTQKLCPKPYANNCGSACEVLPGAAPRLSHLGYAPHPPTHRKRNFKRNETNYKKWNSSSVTSSAQWPLLFGENKNPVAPQLPAQRTFSQDIGHRSFPYPAWQHPHLSLAQTQKTIKLYPHSCGGGAFLVAFLVSLEKEKYMKTERQKVSIAKGLSRFIYD